MNKSELRSILYAKYKSSLLSRIEVAEELNKSIATIDRWKKAGLYLQYKKLGDSKNAAVQYPIDTIVDYILNNNQKVI